MNKRFPWTYHRRGQVSIWRLPKPDNEGCWEVTHYNGSKEFWVVNEGVRMDKYSSQLDAQMWVEQTVRGEDHV